MESKQNLTLSKFTKKHYKLIIGGLSAALIIYYFKNKKIYEQQSQILLKQTAQLREIEAQNENDQNIIEEVLTRRVQRRKIQQLIESDKHQDFGRLQVPENDNEKNLLLEALRYYDSVDCKITRIPHLILDRELTSVPVIINPIYHLDHNEIFINKEEFILCMFYLYLFYTARAHFTDEITFEQAHKFIRAGPLFNIYFKPENVKALIVTCGGLCPGLNNVVREITMQVREIYAARYGYEGVYDPKSWKKMIPEEIKGIHQKGGTEIGTSRGGFDLDKIVKALVENKVNQLYVIGGDGTHRGIYQIYRAIKELKLDIAVAGIPKTIDNDIPIIDCSFGFQTSVEEAQRAIQSARVESQSHRYGVGIVKLMGRDSGWIALNASIAAQTVNLCLLPEFQYNLYGKNGVLEYCYDRIKNRNHLVAVIAEGANLSGEGKDASGNVKFSDVGAFFQKELTKYCQSKDLNITLKYIDPSYMIRSVPANAQDSKYCAYTASNAVHGVMAGFTGFSNGLICGKNALIPISEICSASYNKRIPNDYMNWRRYLLQSGQISLQNQK